MFAGVEQAFVGVFGAILGAANQKNRNPHIEFQTDQMHNIGKKM